MDLLAEFVSVMESLFVYICAKRRRILTCDLRQYGSIYLIMCVLSSFLQPVIGFNIDIERPVIKQGNTGDMFGYSVAQHTDQGQGWILVGAPRAQTGQRGIERGGAVFRCMIDQHNRTNPFPSQCQIIPFDIRGNNRQVDQTGRQSPVEDKSNQWFGATVASSGESGHILACAPRYVYLSTMFDKREPVGTCYLARSGRTSYEEFSPCKGNGTSSFFWSGYHRMGFCQAGMSAVFSDNGNKILIGAPGAYYWQGQVYTYWLDDNNRKFSTKEEGATEDDKYRGYSAAYGNFDSDDYEDYVVGVPRAKKLLGMVQIYTRQLRNIKNITGEQIGSYFGYAVAVQDLNGDKLDDIIVGAPLFSDHTFKSTNTYDTGRVYIYYQNAKGGFDIGSEDFRKFRPRKRVDILDGYDPRSRFGAAVTGMKDINLDTYKDLAVGAPYGGKEGKGAVYIYHGSMKGIITDVSQVIHGKDVLSYISTFGFSLSGGYDLDKNEYPDLLVGAYEADSAVFLKARPVVRVAASLRLDPDLIKLEDKGCEIGDDNVKIKVTCLMVRTCVEYSGTGVSNNLKFDFFWTLDTKRNTSKRMFHFITQQPSLSELDLTLRKNEIYCHDFIVYIRNNIRDKLTPIEVAFKYELKNDENFFGGRKKRQAIGSAIKPVLDKYIPSTVTVSGEISKNCGPDEKCIPDLSVIAERVETFAKPIEVGDNNEEIEISIIVMNNGRYAEDSYKTMLYIEIPDGILYNGITNLNSIIPFSCLPRPVNGTLFIACDMGNPMRAGAKTYFTLLVTPNNTQGTTDKLNFRLNVNSSNPENNTDMWDNVYTMQIDVVQHAMLEISENVRTSTEQVIYNNTGVKLYKGTGNGPEVIHEYLVRNLGPTPVLSSVVNIYWPSYDDLGNHLLHIDEGPTLLNHEGGSCETHLIAPENATDFRYREGSNTLNIQLQTKSKRSRVKRDTTRNVRNVVCNQRFCTFIKCFLGKMPGRMSLREAAAIRIKSHIWTNTLVKRGLTEPFNLVSQALAQVTKMPYSIPVDKKNETFAVRDEDISTYVNADKIAPKKKGVEIWKIAVAIIGGLLLLLIIILLLWWCGFFRRRRPQDEPAYSKPLMKNGQQPKSTDIAARSYE